MVQNWYGAENEIVLLLLKGELHLRGIAQQLGLPHATVKRRLDFLVGENVLDCRIEGKNKVFFIRKNIHAKNYVLNAERYKLIKLLKKYRELDVIIGDLLKKNSEKLIVLFGSYARFAARPDSDIDVYVLTKDRKIKQKLESVHTKIRAKLGPFDMGSPLIREIIKNHVILRGAEEFYDGLGLFN